ncbi:hypothetical protein BT69DRAFT_1327722 [Atractiella rhizophila]|nr:hypothetical protein BT69DRAFT_1327722 [Atractiella rhizophila]
MKASTIVSAWAATGLLVHDHSGREFVSRNHFAEADFAPAGQTSSRTQLPDCIPPDLELALTSSSSHSDNDDDSDHPSNPEEPPTIEHGFYLIDPTTCLPYEQAPTPVTLPACPLHRSEPQASIPGPDPPQPPLTDPPARSSLTVTLHTPITPAHFYPKKPRTVFRDQHGKIIQLSVKSDSRLLYGALSALDNAHARTQFEEGRLRTSIVEWLRCLGEMLEVEKAAEEKAKEGERKKAEAARKKAETAQKKAEKEREKVEKANAREAKRKEKEEAQSQKQKQKSARHAGPSDHPAAASASAKQIPSLVNFGLSVPTAKTPFFHTQDPEPMQQSYSPHQSLQHQIPSILPQ